MSSVRIAIAGSVINPLTLSPVLWIDFADATTISLSGSNITQINDKSGSGYNFTQGTSANQPILASAVLNGRNAGYFDGVNDALTVGSTNLLRNVSGATIFAARKWEVLPAETRTILNIVGGTGLSRMRLASTDSGKNDAGGRTLDADGFVSTIGAADVSTSAAQIQTAVFDYANTDLFQFINGVLDGSTTSFQTATTTSNTASTDTSMGANPSLTGTFFKGWIAEILVYHTALSAANRARVDAYLRNKWGL